MARAPKKKPDPVGDVISGANEMLGHTVEAVNDGLEGGIRAANRAVRTTTETIGRVAQPWVERAAIGVQQLAEAADPAGVRARNLERDSAGFNDWSTLSDGVRGQRHLQPVRVEAPVLPPGVTSNSSPEDIQVAFRRASGMWLPIKTQGAWPKIEDVRRASDLPPDTNARDIRPLASYLPYVESLTGVSRDYMIALKQKENPHDVRGDTGTGARGPYQFIRGTWDDTVDRHGPMEGLPPNMDRDERFDLAEDPRWATVMAAHHQMDNAMFMRKRLGRNPTWGEVYLGHFAGVDKAVHLMQVDQTLPATRFYSTTEIYGKGKGVGNQPSFFPRIGPNRYDTSRPFTVAEHLAHHTSKFPNREFPTDRPTRSAE